MHIVLRARLAEIEEWGNFAWRLQMCVESWQGTKVHFLCCLQPLLPCTEKVMAFINGHWFVLVRSHADEQFRFPIFSPWEHHLFFVLRMSWHVRFTVYLVIVAVWHLPAVCHLCRFGSGTNCYGCIHKCKHLCRGSCIVVSTYSLALPIFANNAICEP